MSFNEWMVKQIVVHTSIKWNTTENKKEQTTDMHNYLDKPQENYTSLKMMHATIPFIKHSWYNNYRDEE